MAPSKKSEDIRIVVLQRGWVMVGRFEQKGAQCVRRWGTTKGLGEIAAAGPSASTVLDPAGEVQFHELTAILTLACEVSKWSARLQ